MHPGMVLKRAFFAIAGLAIATSAACGKKAEPSATKTSDTKAAADTKTAPTADSPKTKVPFQKFDKNDRRAVDDYIAGGQGRDFSGGVKELKSEDLSVGKGEAVKKGDTVKVHVVSTLFTTGRQVFKTTPDAPLTFKVGDGTKIVGLEEGIVGMKIGGKRKLTIPPAKAHGKRGQRVTVPSNATLVYEVDLVEISH